MVDLFRLLSIDPGSSNLGVAIIDIEIPRNKFTVPLALSEVSIKLIDARTLDCDKNANRYKSVQEVHGNRVARLFGIEQWLSGYLQTWNPDVVACESPYMGRFPQAYAALTECLFVIRSSIMDYDPTKQLNLFDPATVKQSVGVSGKSGDKTLVKKALELITAKFEMHNGVCIGKLDEHAIDALAVGITYLITSGKLRL